LKIDMICNVCRSLNICSPKMYIDLILCSFVLGVSCDSCLKGNFRGRRYKCLICYDYDLCATCYEAGATTTRHTTEHPMQCILTRSDFGKYVGCVWHVVVHVIFGIYGTRSQRCVISALLNLLLSSTQARFHMCTDAHQRNGNLIHIMIVFSEGTTTGSLLPSSHCRSWLHRLNMWYSCYFLL
jgi:hypothetical protein